MRRFCQPLCSVAKQNRFTSPRHVIVNGRKVMVSAKSSLQSDGLIAALELADRIWQGHQEALFLGRTEPNPFAWVGLNEPHLRQALRAKGYL